MLCSGGFKQMGDIARMCHNFDSYAEISQNSDAALKLGMSSLSTQYYDPHFIQILSPHQPIYSIRGLELN